MNSPGFSVDKVIGLWNQLSSRFNTHKETEEIHPDAVVNIIVGWPVIFTLISDYLHKNKIKNPKFFDFGCGAGSFCKALKEKGFDIVGLDQSDEMILLAKKHNPEIEFNRGRHDSDFFDYSENFEKFDVITSIHSLEWFEDLPLAFKNFYKILKRGGLFIFAVFPKSYIIESLKMSYFFKNFDDLNNPVSGTGDFDGIEVPVFIRDSMEFDSLLKEIGFVKSAEIVPVYPDDFFDKYALEGPHSSEMIIYAYKKI